MISIISKSHSINVSAIPATNFIVYANLWSIIINGIAYYIFADRLKKPKKINIQKDTRDIDEVRPNKIHAVLTAAVFAIVGGVGFLFQLISAATVPAVALYPFVTGGAIVLSSLGARIFFKEKISKPALAGIIMSVCGTLLFLIN